MLLSTLITLNSVSVCLKTPQHIVHAPSKIACGVACVKKKDCHVSCFNKDNANCFFSNDSSVPGKAQLRQETSGDSSSNFEGPNGPEDFPGNAKKEISLSNQYDWFNIRTTGSLCAMQLDFMNRRPKSKSWVMNITNGFRGGVASWAVNGEIRAVEKGRQRYLFRFVIDEEQQIILDVSIMYSPVRDTFNVLIHRKLRQRDRLTILRENDRFSFSLAFVFDLTRCSLDFIDLGRQILLTTVGMKTFVKASFEVFDTIDQGTIMMNCSDPRHDKFTLNLLHNITGIY